MWSAGSTVRQWCGGDGGRFDRQKFSDSKVRSLDFGVWMSQIHISFPFSAVTCALGATSLKAWQLTDDVDTCSFQRNTSL